MKVARFLAGFPVVRECPVCRGPFAAKGKRAHCSLRCAATARKRRQRARVRSLVVLLEAA